MQATVPHFSSDFCSWAPCRSTAAQSPGKSWPVQRSTCCKAYRSSDAFTTVPVSYPPSGPSNLGVLQRLIEQDPVPSDSYGMQRVSPGSLSSRGFYTDGSSIFGSAVLLIVLLFLTLSQILGLDRFMTKALSAWRKKRSYERRVEIMDARQSLEDLWDKDNGQSQQ
eukprot:GHRR01010294.1.p1 GENE.GHRR01010294.1~~GHRR01010294.1.p1  ORF type:complete len:166 (+),score=30.90 GHRR01010294.1:181-678(+)